MSMFSHLERPALPPPGWRQVLADFGPTYAANGFIGFVFAATAPVAIILSVGVRGGLSEAELASWIFGVFFVNGLIGMLLCWLYRQPLAFFWTIPGTVLVGPALAHLSFAEVIGLQGLFMQGANLGQFIGPPLVASRVAESGRWQDALLVTGTTAALGVILGQLARRFE